MTADDREAVTVRSTYRHDQYYLQLAGAHAESHQTLSKRGLNI
jgi:hypothetical protein